MTDISQHLPKQSKTVEAIYAHYKKAGDEGHMGRTLPVSLIGHECERYLWYVFRQCCKPEFSGRMYRLFDTGNLEEARFTKDLRDIGCTVHDIDEATGKQFKVTALGGHLKGYMDGAILGIPEAPKTWHVGEYKTHNAKSFKELIKKGVQESHPKHYAQMMIEMHLTNMWRALYLARNKDTDELHSERIHYNEAEAQGLMNRARRIITAVAPPDRISNRPDWYQCGWCDAKSICHGTEPSEPALGVPALSCRQCCHATPNLERENGEWICEKYNGILRENPEPCEDHLILPGLIPFAEPTDFGVNEEGNDFIEFTNKDGTKWGHGNAAGCYSSRELLEIPANLLSNEMIKSTKDLFGATVIDHGMDILQRYPKEDSRTIWEGLGKDLVFAWRAEYHEDLLSLEPIARDIEADYSAVELDGGRVAIIYRKTVTAEIRAGVE